MNNKLTFALALSALVCGIAIGYGLHPSGSGTPTETKTPLKPRKSGLADESEVARLQRRLRDLERQLAQRRPPTAPTAAAPERAETATGTTNATPQPVRRGPPTAADMRARMEEMRKNDPQRYTQMTNRFAQMRQRNLSRVQNQLDLLESVDRSRLTKAEQDVHDQYQEAVARREELREMLNPQNEGITEEQRREAFRELRDLDRQTQRLAESERNTLLTQAARDLGVTGTEAAEFAETVSAIYEATQTRGGPGGPRHHGDRPQ